MTYVRKAKLGEKRSLPLDNVRGVGEQIPEPLWSNIQSVSIGVHIHYNDLINHYYLFALDMIILGKYIATTKM